MVIRRRPVSGSSFRSSRKLIVGVVAVVAFAGLGVYLLQPSRAAPVANDEPLLSFAPASFALQKGQVVNIAVTINSRSIQLGDIAVTVNYPSSLQLQAVRDLCLAPIFANRNQASPVSGKVSIRCNGGAG